MAGRQRGERPAAKLAASGGRQTSGEAAAMIENRSSLFAPDDDERKIAPVEVEVDVRQVVERADRVHDHESSIEVPHRSLGLSL
jgi:hypothetical protein